MVPVPCITTEPVPPPAYHHALVKRGPRVQIEALTLVTTLHLLALCRLAVHVVQEERPLVQAGGRRGRPVVYPPASLLLIGLLRVLWRLSYRDMTDWLVAWPALAFGLRSARRPAWPAARPESCPPMQAATRLGRSRL